MEVSERLATVKEALQQYEDGAITYIEFVVKAQSMITVGDLQEYNMTTGSNLAPGDFARYASHLFGEVK